MQIAEITDNESVQVIKNIDYALRMSNSQRVLITADYPKENHFQLAKSLAKTLHQVYGHKIYLFDENDHDIDPELTKNKNKLEIYLDELQKYHDFIFYVHHLNQNIETTLIPEINLDSALLVRSKISVGVNRNRYITHTLEDANINILGLVYNQD